MLLAVVVWSVAGLMLAMGAFLIAKPEKIQNWEIAVEKKAFRNAKWFSNYGESKQGEHYRQILRFGGVLLVCMSLIIFVFATSLFLGFDIITGAPMQKQNKP